MSSLIAGSMLSAVLACCACYVLMQRVWLKRVQVLERDLQAVSGAIDQMAEIQMKSYQKLSGNLGEIEERILELAIPSQDSNPAPQRRRRVVALANKGSSIDEVARRANVSRGEAELVMSLQRFRAADAPKSPKANGDVKPYAQA